MRLLSNEELQFVAGTDGGVGDVADTIAVGGAVGGGILMGIAQKAGIESGAKLLTAGGVGAVAGAALTASFIAGYAAGNWLNENTGVQEWISNGIDAGGRMLDMLDFSWGGGGGLRSDASYFQNVSSV